MPENQKYTERLNGYRYAERCCTCKHSRLFELIGADILTCTLGGAPEFNGSPIQLTDVCARRVDEAHVCDDYAKGKTDAD